MHSENEVPSYEEPTNITRRSVVVGSAATIAALLSGGGTYLAMRPQSQEKKLAGLRSDFEKRKANAFKEGPLHTNTVRELVIDQETLQYLEAQKWGDNLPTPLALPSSLEKFRTHQIDPFMRAVLTDFQERDKETQQRMGETHAPFHRLVDLKTSLQEIQGPTLTYNEAYNSPLYGMQFCRDGKRRVQCASESQLLLLLADMAGMDDVVVIHFDGHLLPGLVSKDGKLSGVEMTKRGPAQVQFGSIEELKNSDTYEMKVTRLHDYLLLCLLDSQAEIKQVSKRGVLVDTAPKKQLEGKKAVAQNVKRNDPLAFGTPDADPGDKEMGQELVIRPDVFAKGSSIYAPKEREVFSTPLLPSDMAFGKYGVRYENGEFIDTRTNLVISKDQAWEIYNRNRPKDTFDAQSVIIDLDKGKRTGKLKSLPFKSQGTMVQPGSPDDPTRWKIDIKDKK